MDSYLCDQLIGILKEIKETNHTMEMDNPYENPDFEKNWFRPAERQHYHLIDKFIETIKKNSRRSKLTTQNRGLRLSILFSFFII